MTTASKVISAPDEDLGFPAGYFVLKNTGSDRMLDVDGGSVDDGTEVLLFPEKEKSLVEGVCEDLCSCCGRIRCVGDEEWIVNGALNRVS